jgi:PAS domain S-box-containing protein
MIQEPTIASLPDLSSQITSLEKTAEKIYASFQTACQTLPHGTIESLNQLLSGLARINQQVSQHEEERTNLSALADIGQVVNSTLELSEVLRVVMDTIVRLTRAERGFLMLRDNNLPESPLTVRIARNWEMESIDSSELELSHTVINRVVAEGSPILTTNAQSDPRFTNQESIIAYNLRSILCVPLKVKGEVTWVIYADNRIHSGIFTETERELLTAFANQAAVAIENARLFESVRTTLAEVTGLKNLMDNVFASIASGVITADINDTITLCNRATERILDQKAGDMVGSSLENVLLPLASELSLHIANVRRTSQHMVGLEFTPTLPKRGPVTLSLNLSPLIDADQSTQGVAIVMEDLTERKKLEAQRRLFGRMVSPAVIEQLNPNELHLGGNRAVITTLFVDMRGFTSFSEITEPEQLVSILNRYLAAAAEAILSQQGTIDKFLGDAVMAWFNAPIPQPDHTYRAVCAALAIRDAVRLQHEHLPPEYRLSFGVGIHYGEAVLGLVGTEARLEYTAIGDSVNTAKRIQENSAPEQILISAEAYDRVSHKVIAHLVEPIIAKGKRQPIEVFEVTGLRPPPGFVF